MFKLITLHNCGNCGHREQVSGKVPPGEPDGECHGVPPQIVAFAIPAAPMPGLPPSMQVQVQTLFPRVNSSWHCGMWKAKIETAQPGTKLS